MSDNHPAIVASGLGKVYPSKQRVVAIESVSFTVGQNEIVGLLGPNGAGKTTTIKCLCGLVEPTAGQVILDGVDIVKKPHLAGERVSALLEGNRNIYWRLSVRENLEFFAALQGRPTAATRRSADELIEAFSLTAKRDTPAGQMSKGMQQRLALACALVRETPILLLDEPTLGLDVEASLGLQEILRGLPALNRTVLLSSHDMHLIERICERVIIVNSGHVVVDDKIRNLLALFQRRAYVARVREPVGDIETAMLRERFPEVTVDNQNGGGVISVDLEPGDTLHELLRILEGNDHLIDSIEQATPNLEQAFLNIVRGAVRQ